MLYPVVFRSTIRVVVLLKDTATVSLNSITKSTRRHELSIWSMECVPHSKWMLRLAHEDRPEDEVMNNGRVVWHRSYDSPSALCTLKMKEDFEWRCNMESIPLVENLICLMDLYSISAHDIFLLQGSQ